MLTLPILSLLIPALSMAQAIDPFLWLEEIDSSTSLAWVARQNQSTEARLTTQPLFAQLEGELKRIVLNAERLPSLSLIGGQVYTVWQDAAHPRGVWQRTSLERYATGRPEWEEVLDLDALGREENAPWVWKSADCLPQTDRCLVRLSRGGSDAAEIREFDLHTKMFVADGFRVPEAKSYVSWIHRDAIYLGTNFGTGSVSKSGYPLHIRAWQRGQALADAPTVFRGEGDDMVASAQVTHEPGRAPTVLYRRGISFFEQEYYVPLGERTVKLPFPTDAEVLTTVRGKAIYLLRSPLTVDGVTYSTGSLVAYPLAEAPALRGLEEVFRPSATTFLQSLERSGDALLLNVLENVRGRVKRARFVDGAWALDNVSFDENGMAEATEGDAYSPLFLATYMDFLTPTTQYAGSSETGEARPLRSSPAFFDAAGLVTEQWFATSRDGTRVPYFVVHRRDWQLDATNPTLLYGYGGFQVPMVPRYSGAIGKAWLEKGGVYVLGNIRGGGEFGPDWHRAALREHRQRAFDDFLAIADDLIARGVTSPAHLGIQGGSNGGLLVGAALTQRPELFRAVLCEVPLLDMLRYHRLLAGHSWMDEYGDPDRPEDRAFLERYSPYQNLREGVNYPEVFFLTSTRDDRVHPGHARKMAARLESLGQNVFFYENTEGGHGGSATPEQRARIAALEYTYLWSKLAR